MKPSVPTDTDPARFDVRAIPCSVKHPQILQRWADLPVGGHFILVNDHDPEPLFYQFSACFPGAFTWEHLLRKEDEVHIRITRLAETKTGMPPLPSSCGQGS